MTINQDKEDLNRAIELLYKASIALDHLPTYRNADFEIDSYYLTDEIEKFLKEIKENDSREPKN